MSYAHLQGGAGRLGRYQALDTPRQQEAQAEADAFIDREFESWDRSAWSGPNVPPDVATCAMLIGSAAYIERDMAAVNPMVAPESAGHMRHEARSLAREAKGRGWIVGPDGQRLYDRSGTAAPSMTARLVR